MYATVNDQRLRRGWNAEFGQVRRVCSWTAAHWRDPFCYQSGVDRMILPYRSMKAIRDQVNGSIDLAGLRRQRAMSGDQFRKHQREVTESERNRHCSALATT